MYYSQVPYSIDISSDNPNKILLWSSLNGLTYIPSSVSSKDFKLFIQDMNLNKQFKFNLSVPNHKEDSAYYCFMNNYTRNSYNSVTAEFKIYELCTPEGVNTGVFHKYLIYDQDEKYFVPMGGLDIYTYSGSCDSGGNFTFTESQVEKSSHIVNEFFESPFVTQAIVGQATNGFIDPDTSLLDKFSHSVLSLGQHIFNNYLNSGAHIFGLNLNMNFTSSMLKKVYYYGDFIIHNNTEFDGTNYYRIRDIAFASDNVISYSNEYTSRAFENDYYNIIKNTIVRDSNKYKVGEDTYLITFINGEDITSLLPSGTNTQYLNSPVFKNSEDSINGGFLLANIEDVINGDKVINYNYEYSPIYNTYKDSIINDFTDSNDSSVDNSNNDYIDSTDSDSDLIKNFITYLKSINDKLENLANSSGNTINNFTNSFQNFYTIDRLALQDTTDSFIDTFNDSMGIIADLPTMALYFLGRFANLNNGEITFTLPHIELFDVTLIETTTFSFTQMFEQNEIFNYLHNIILVCSDVALLGILLQLAKNAFEEVKR